MAFDYLLMPVNDEMLEYAQQAGVQLPEPAPEGRLPTTDELLAIAKSLPEHQITRLHESDGLEVTVESYARVPIEPVTPFTQTSAAASHLHISANSTGPGGSYQVAFHGNADLMVTIVSQLSRDCGGLVFIATNDGVPWFVLPNVDTPIGPEEWWGTIG